MSTFNFKMKIDIEPAKLYADNRIEKCVEVVKKHAFNIQANSAKNAPVDTGALKNSIQAKESEKTDKNWIIEDGVSYGKFQELGTSRVPAKHFLGNACEVEADKFFKDVKEALK